MPPNNHAVLSASSSHRWLHCTPSARLELEFDSSTSEAAAEGSAAHALAEHMLRIEIESLQADAFDLALTGFDEKELSKLFDDGNDAKDDDFDVDEELKKPTFSKAGEAIQHCEGDPGRLALVSIHSLRKNHPPSR